MQQKGLHAGDICCYSIWHNELQELTTKLNMEFAPESDGIITDWEKIWDILWSMSVQLSYNCIQGSASISESIWKDLHTVSWIHYVHIFGRHFWPGGESVGSDCRSLRVILSLCQSWDSNQQPLNTGTDLNRCHYQEWEECPQLYLKADAELHTCIGICQ